MIIPIVIPFGNPYIKKEDVKDYARQNKYSVGMVWLSFALVLLFMQLLVYPRLINLYAELAMQTPPITSLYPILSWALIIVSVFLSISTFGSKTYEGEIINKASKYAHKEMIHIRHLVDPSLKWKFVSIIIGMVILLVFSLILPIYNLTNSIK